MLNRICPLSYFKQNLRFFSSENFLVVSLCIGILYSTLVLLTSRLTRIDLQNIKTYKGFSTVGFAHYPISSKISGFFLLKTFWLYLYVLHFSSTHFSPYTYRFTKY